MKNLTGFQVLSIAVAALSGLAGLIATLGMTWGFSEVAGQISETCFAVSGFVSVVFGGQTLGKYFAEKKAEG